MFEIRNSFAHREDSWSGISAIINKTHSVEEFNEIIKGRLLHIKVANKFSKEITNIFTYYGYQQSQKEDEKLILHINKVDRKINDEKLENIVYLSDFNYVTVTSL